MGGAERSGYYSLLNASIGFNFAALLAGIYPKSRPIPTDTPKETATAPNVGLAEIPMACPTSLVATAPTRIPIRRRWNWSLPLQSQTAA